MGIDVSSIKRTLIYAWRGVLVSLLALVYIHELGQFFMNSHAETSLLDYP